MRIVVDFVLGALCLTLSRLVTGAVATMFMCVGALGLMGVGIGWGYWYGKREGHERAGK